MKYVYICLFFLAKDQSSNSFLTKTAKSCWLYIFYFNYETEGHSNNF